MILKNGIPSHSCPFLAADSVAIPSGRPRDFEGLRGCCQRLGNIYRGLSTAESVGAGRVLKGEGRALKIAE